MNRQQAGDPETLGPYSQAYGYDTWGNMTTRFGWGGWDAGYVNWTPSYNNNRMTTNPATSASMQYDASGNLTNDGYQSYTYDATWQQTFASGMALSQGYDGDGLRVKKTDNGVTTYYLRSSVLGGQVVAELNASGGWTRGYVYLGGQMLAIQSAGVSWVHQDPVTKSQRITDSSGAVTSTIDLDPWGGETASSNPVFQPHRFTTYERDGNDGDEAMMRRYSGKWHRFHQPDPYDGAYNPTDPQSFNRYSYVQNDPVNFVDPSGLFAIRGDGPPPRNPWDDLPIPRDPPFFFPIEPPDPTPEPEPEPQNPTPQQPQQPKPGCKQDKTGGDRGDILDLLGRAGLSGDISNIQSAGPKNPEGITFNIGNRQAFVDTLNADPRFRHGTPFGGEHTGQVSGNIGNTLDYRSFTTSRDWGLIVMDSGEACR